MKKIKLLFKKLDLKNNPNTVLAIILEVILICNIIVTITKGISLLGYISIAVIAIMNVGMCEYNYRRYQNLKEKNN